MKRIILTIVTAMFSSSAFAAQEYDCTHNGNSLGFTIDQQAGTINFHDVDYLGYAQILTDHNFPAKLTSNTISFEYDWYYTAFYELTFKQPLVRHTQMQEGEMLLTYDDDDGSYESDILFQCNITNINL